MRLSIDWKLIATGLTIGVTVRLYAATKIATDCRTFMIAQLQVRLATIVVGCPTHVLANLGHARLRFRMGRTDGFKAILIRTIVRETVATS